MVGDKPVANYIYDAALVSYLSVGIPLLLWGYIVAFPFFVFGNGAVPKMAGILFAVFLAAVWFSVGFGVYQILWNLNLVKALARKGSYAGAVRNRERESVTELLHYLRGRSPKQRLIVAIMPVVVTMVVIFSLPFGIELALYIKYSSVWDQFHIRDVTILMLVLTLPAAVVQIVVYQYVIFCKLMHKK